MISGFFGFMAPGWKQVEVAASRVFTGSFYVSITLIFDQEALLNSSSINHLDYCNVFYVELIEELQKLQLYYIVI